MRRALVDVDDGSPDGNRRVHRGFDGRANGEDRAFSTPDGRRGDGRVSMADFRALRDAMTAVLALRIAGEGAMVALDGAADHPKRDLNEDGCVYGSGSAGCASAPEEAVHARFDFNGDGTVDPDSRRDVQGVARTDLEVLVSLWPFGDASLSEGWDGSELAGLLPHAPYAQFGSGDVSFRFAAPEDDYDEVRVALTQGTTPVTRTLGQVGELVWTLPIGRAHALTAEGWKGGARVKELCAFRGGDKLTQLPALNHAEDIVVKIDECEDDEPTGPDCGGGGHAVCADYCAGIAGLAGGVCLADNTCECYCDGSNEAYAWCRSYCGNEDAVCSFYEFPSVCEASERDKFACLCDCDGQ